MEELVKCVHIVAVYLGNSCVGYSLHVELVSRGARCMHVYTCAYSLYLCVSMWLPRVLGLLYYVVTSENFELEFRDACLNLHSFLECSESGTVGGLGPGEEKDTQ